MTIDYPNLAMLKFMASLKSRLVRVLGKLPGLLKTRLVNALGYFKPARAAMANVLFNLRIFKEI